MPPCSGHSWKFKTLTKKEMGERKRIELYCIKRQGRGSKGIIRIRSARKGSKEIRSKRKKGKDKKRINIL